MNIKCYTLYDITRTNISYRKKFADGVTETERKQRSQQTNLETIFQIINMRSQPEDISEVKRNTIPLTELQNYDFGYLLAEKYSNGDQADIWTFTFKIEHPDVFNNGIDDLGYLIQDCDRVPMIIGLDESFKLTQQLNTSSELRNIYFEVVR